MYVPFFTAAARAPARQFSWRLMVAMHIVLVGCVCWMTLRVNGAPPVILGWFLLVASLIEGAIMIGWRMTQLPKSRAMEFWLASPLRPYRIFLSELAIGVFWFTCSTFSALPVLLWLSLDGVVRIDDFFALLMMPFVMGIFTGAALAVWAYEPKSWRKIAERILMACILIYLVIGVLAGEKLGDWLELISADVKTTGLSMFRAVNNSNPFIVTERMLSNGMPFGFERFVWVVSIVVAVSLLLIVRAAYRLQPHFHERHYSPVRDVAKERRSKVGARPLTWWALKRVSEYSGKVNMWLAGGFGLLYAVHILAGDAWPVWMGRGVFQTFDAIFGAPGIAASLIVLSAVPAAYQYGLWDGNIQDRCRRLELLLMTNLNGQDYLTAALAAAWRRGRGYFIIASLLWASLVVAGQMPLSRAVAAAMTGAILWLLYFSIGFRAFTKGAHANHLGLILTVGLPILSVVLLFAGQPFLAALLPPGLVWHASSTDQWWTLLPGTVAASALILALHRPTLQNCIGDLRRWYELHYGRKIA